MAKFKIQKTATVNEYFDATNVIGGVGGLTSITGNQVQVQGYVTKGVQSTGSILRAKGRSKFLINDSTAIQDENIQVGNSYVITTVGNTNWKALGGPESASVGDIFTATVANPAITTNGVVNLLGVCTLTDSAASGLAAGQMSVDITTSKITSGVLTNLSPITTTYAYLTFSSSNVTGPLYPSVGQQVSGTALSGIVTVTSITTNGGTSNANVSFSSQTVANASSLTLTMNSYASRLTNKFVTDFNNHKFQWTFGNPTATTVQITGA